MHALCFKLLILAIASFLVAESSVPCGNSNQCCNNGESCCRLQNGTFGCFPEENAVCCGGSSFACLKDYVCHMQFGMCINMDIVMPPVSPSHRARSCKKDKLADVPSVRGICGVSGACATNATCCQNAQMCCTLPDAVCCGDNLHCCPANYTCDINLGGCVSSNKTMFHEVSHALSRRSIDFTPKAVLCPDHTACMDDQTCCAVPSGRFACCPYPKGVCCSDGQHCCPHSYECDLSHQRCVKKWNWFDMIAPTPMEQSPAETVDQLDDAVELPRVEVHEIKLEANKAVREIVCPDPTYKCADNTTCCHLSSGVYGCCPYPNAVCCTDGNHCCPNGYSCDSVHQRCVSSPDSLFRKFAMERPEKLSSRPLFPFGNRPLTSIADARKKGEFVFGEVLCPDKSSVCDEGTTCCQMSDGTYGCCPYPNATCCSDQQHCCPNGFTCDLVHQQCAKSAAIEMPMQFVVIETIFGDDRTENQPEDNNNNIFKFLTAKESKPEQDETNDMMAMLPSQKSLLSFFREAFSMFDNVMRSSEARQSFQPDEKKPESEKQEDDESSFDFMPIKFTPNV